jgi:hypothetical protein
MASKVCKGSEGIQQYPFLSPYCPFLSSLALFSLPTNIGPEILALRYSMWQKVSSRKHTPMKIFPFGPSSDEIMLYGTVDYVLKDGGEAKLDWSARAHLVEEGGMVRMDFYQVYLVSQFACACILLGVNVIPGGM